MTTRNHRVRFMENNFAEETGITVSYSSQLASFPATNAYQNKQRNKPWKPSGCFEITALNNKIYINDGSLKTATITIQTYSTPAALATEMATQLNSISTGWSVSYNVAQTYKFRISHASAHTIVFSNNTNAVWDTIGYTYITNQVILSYIEANEQRNHTSEWLKFDFGTQQLVTFVGIISKLSEVFAISETAATLKIQANNLDVWTSPPLDLTLTRSDGGILKFIDDLNDTSYRYWRFYFVDKLNPVGPEGFSFGYIYLGDYLTFDDRNIFNGFQKTIIDPSVINESESGVLYANERPKYSELTGATIGFLSQAQRNQIQQLFYDYGKTNPFFISFDPTLCFTDDMDDLTKYVVFESNPTMTHIIHEKFNIALSFREVL